MPRRAVHEQLLAASPRARRRLIERRPMAVGEAEVDAIAERARAAATADPAESQRLADIAQALAEALGAPRGRALALRALGVALRAQARWSEAVGAFQEGARLAET